MCWADYIVQGGQSLIFPMWLRHSFGRTAALAARTSTRHCQACLLCYVLAVTEVLFLPLHQSFIHGLRPLHQKLPPCTVFPGPLYLFLLLFCISWSAGPAFSSSIPQHFWLSIAEWHSTARLWCKAFFRGSYWIDWGRKVPPHS